MISEGTPVHKRWTLAVLVAAACLLVAAPAAHAVPPAPSQVTVTRSGFQLATVTDSGGQINCGTDCTGTYEWPCSAENSHGACIGWEAPSVSLSTAPPTGFRVRWVGVSCEEGSNLTNDCTVTGAATVDAHFEDATPPAVTLTSPLPGTAKGTIDLSATASDSQTGVRDVQFRVGDDDVGSADASDPYGVSFNTTSRSDGPVTVTAIATNKDGGASTATASITIDNTAPTINVTNGPAGQTFGPGTTQKWDFTASDVTSNVAAVECSVVAAGAPDSFGACSGGSTSHSVANKPGGSYSFKVRVRDGAGHVTTSPARAFTIDATPPETSITSGAADGSSSTDSSYTFGLGSSEPGSSFECRVYPAALTPPAFGSCSSAVAHTASGFSAGTYAFEVRATDPYGNKDASPAKRTFTVTAPGGTGTDPGTGTGTGGGTTSTGGTAGTGGETAGTGGGTTTTTTTTTTVTTTAFDPRITSLFFYKGKLTRFTQLVVSKLPAGAKVTASCTGKGCAFKKKAIGTAGAKLNVLKKLKRVRLRSGAVLQLKISGPAGELKIATWKIRTGKAPAMSYRCAPAGGKLGRCT